VVWEGQAQVVQLPGAAAQVAQVVFSPALAGLTAAGEAYLAVVAQGV
jgi:hypothetical protein